MNPDEKIAERYLRARGFDPVHEPNGKQPPDFSISATTGIEVRRLNESYSDGNKSHGLENVAINLPRMITSIFKEFDSQDSQNGYWVGLEYRRPIAITRSLREEVRTQLNNFLCGPLTLPSRLQVNPNLILDIFETNEAAPTFSLGCESDMDEGGFIIPRYIDEINRCIDEKAEKIRNFYSSYKSWWLVLVDYIAMVRKSDISKVASGLIKRDCWTRVLVINRSGVETGIEI